MTGGITPNSNPRGDHELIRTHIYTPKTLSRK
nr:MAG TPA: hypothetical protein [Crassvirales sp.]